MGAKQDLTRRRFGRWLVICEDDRRAPESGAHVKWICRCDCGEVGSLRSDVLTHGRSLSCGCLASEVAAKVGEARQRARYRGEEYQRPEDADRIIAEAIERAEASE